VVPRCAKQFRVEDRDGMTLWRIILWKSALTDFTTACRSEKWIVREFIYDPKFQLNQSKSREELLSNYDKKSGLLHKTCRVVFSELYICLMHLKALRLFVESVLRFSLPPTFFAFGVEPEEGRERKMQDILIRKFLKEGESVDLYLRQDSDEGDDFFPYVLVPLNLVVGR
jgi:V-type H+-transporting ATPase subunit C